MPGIWVEVQRLFYARQLAFLSPDSILALRNSVIERSTDRGQTWAEVYPDDGGADLLFEVPEGHPFAGTLFAHTRTQDPLRSTDRGDTWAPPTFSTGLDGNEVQAMIAVPDGPWPPGRLIAGGYYGITASDDGGASFAPLHPWEFLRYRAYGFATVDGPGGAPRLLALISENMQPNLRIWSSDDGGRTWSYLSAIPATNAKAMAGLGGAAALLATSEGNVWRTGDAGVTWQVVGRVPGTDAGDQTRPGVSSVLSDGRLYVHIQGSNEINWVWRTTEPVAVASPAPPPSATVAALAVRPNPSSGTSVATLTLTVPSAVRVVVVDVLGREVSVVADRSFGAGEHVLPLGVTLAPGTYVVRAEVTTAGTARALVGTFTVVR